MQRKTVVLLICDGWGEAPASPGNAITLADAPTFDRWRRRCPRTTLEASGEAVGLPAGLMGNSEVGHLNLGAGRMVPQDLLRIDQALAGGSFFENPALLEAMEHARRPGAALHLLGLLSDGGVHSHERHLFGLLAMAERRGVPRVVVHAFTDGRDTPPRSALRYIQNLEDVLGKTGGEIGTVTGRYYAMDRDARWDRVSRAYAALVSGSGERAASARQAVENAYSRGENDEFIQPTVVGRPEKPSRLISDGDAAVFFNFRADRARQLTRALTETGFSEFDRGDGLSLKLVCFTRYKKEFTLPVAFPPLVLDGILAVAWAEHGVRNLRLAETEKYAHVTYFFNGGVEKAFNGEERVLVPSWRGATYDLHPEMSAGEITREAVAAIQGNTFDALVVNFANADMVGHTGKIPETVKAIETLDACFARLEASCAQAGAVLLMTADHGNAEQMLDPSTGQPHTAHTTNPVPAILVNSGTDSLRSGGTLADVAPTILGLQGLPVPKEMTGRDLREK
ncbi:MAG TPA: 2,3-bisphosphoglycerate-independent phosphoglycerate mutase [Thermoanaerobaculia bacterium]|nr:2,3-bisphosphoglycerate-independent phosphoglycerate mutase [Thermoanaerobaculia bacterium]